MVEEIENAAIRGSKGRIPEVPDDGELGISEPRKFKDQKTLLTSLRTRIIILLDRI